MTRRLGGGEQRRRSVLRSLETQSSGGFTTYAAKLMAAGLGGTEEVCTVTGHFQTSVFEFPGCRLTSERPIAPQTIAKHSELTAAIVSNLPAYFQKGYAGTSHYAIDVSLRAAVERVYRKESAQNRPTPARLFVVIEQEARVSPTTFERGECFMIDEYRDGQELIEGGREGKRTLLAVRTVNGVWPSFSPDLQARNAVLAAVKIEQNATHHLEERCGCSCFVSDDGRAICTLHPKMEIGYGGVRVESPINGSDLEAKVSRIRSIHDGIRRDSRSIPQMAELVDSVLLDKTRNEGHFRLWYLRLWQAALDAKKHLGESKLESSEAAIVGKLTPKELHEYRNRIAHWWTGKVDFSFVTGVQQTVLELLRRKYGTRD